MSKLLTEGIFINKASRGPVEIDNSLFYVVIKVNSTNFNLNKALKSQLEKERKYDETYVGFITRERTIPYSVENLSVYGDSKQYVTKHFNQGLVGVIIDDLKDKDLNLLERANSWLSKED